MSNDNHMKEPTSEKEDVSPLGYIAKASENVFSVMKLLLGVSVMIGVIYNFGYFYNLGIAYTIFLDYTDFLYTPLFIIGKIISLSLIIVTIRLTWMSWPKAAAIDRAFTVVIFILHKTAIGRGYGGYGGGYGGYAGYGGYDGYYGGYCDPYWLVVNPMMCM